MQISEVPIVKPEETNVILGHSHFIKTVEDLYEAMAEAASGLRFGVAFAEASGPCLVRFDGNDVALMKLASDAMMAIGAGHTFAVFMEGGYPVNVLNAIKGVSEVCTVYCATANPVRVLVAATDLGRAVVGVVDGSSPKGVETEADQEARRGLLRAIGYKR
jgi:uncharacterized protein